MWQWTRYELQDRSILKITSISLPSKCPYVRGDLHDRHRLSYIWWTTLVPEKPFRCWVCEKSINQSNPVLLKERVRIPRTRRAGGAALLWRRLPLDGVGSSRLFFTDDLHDNLSWVPASDKPHTFKSCFTHSSEMIYTIGAAWDTYDVQRRRKIVELFFMWQWISHSAQTKGTYGDPRREKNI